MDHGDGSMVRDPATGKYRGTQLVVMTLGYSPRTERLLTCLNSLAIELNSLHCVTFEIHAIPSLALDCASHRRKVSSINGRYRSTSATASLKGDELSLERSDIQPSIRELPNDLIP